MLYKYSGLREVWVHMTHSDMKPLIHKENSFFRMSHDEIHRFMLSNT